MAQAATAHTSRNRAAGSFVKRYAAKEGMIFTEPTFEFSYKRDDLGDPLINDSHAIAFFDS